MALEEETYKEVEAGREGCVVWGLQGVRALTCVKV
jgi:hypothetical protein